MNLLDNIGRINEQRRSNISKAFNQDSPDRYFDQLEKGGNKHDFSTKERESLAKKGQAMEDGSFPVRNRQDLIDAIKSIGRAKDPSKVRAWIRRRAKALGLQELIPEHWAK